MTNLVSINFPQYELLDSGMGQKLETICGVKVIRPCPQAIWEKKLGESEWNKATSIVHRTKDGGGKWEHKKGEPKEIILKYLDLNFELKFTPFGHCGLFFEQLPIWEMLTSKVKEKSKELDRKVKALNLFGYTGAATLCMASAGAEVFHVDSAKGVLTWGEKNAKRTPKNFNIRWVQEDVNRFVEHSVKRGFKYDVILADPPSWGHGAGKELWDFNDHICGLVKNLSKILEQHDSLLVLSTHTHGVQQEALKNLFLATKSFSKIQIGELGVKHLNDERVLPAGIYCAGVRG